MRYTVALGFAFVSVAFATPRGMPDGSEYTIVKRDDDYNTTCSIQDVQSWGIGALSKKVKDMGGNTDGIKLEAKDPNGCSEIKEACNCGNGAWICDYTDTPVIAQDDLSKIMGNSLTDCGIQWGNTDGKDFDGVWGVKIDKAGYNIRIAGGAKSCGGC